MRFWLGFLGVLTCAHAGSQVFTSSATRTHLLELFTSEGCSSCPPAEAWLGTLRSAPGLWRDFVPIAWHVNYWDRLGWKDRFASKQATERQYAYADRWPDGTVYTPCFILDGSEWHARVIPAAESSRIGVLRATYDGQDVMIEFTGGTDPAAPATAATRYAAHAVILELGATSMVRAGENRGRELHHTFVAKTPQQSASVSNGGARIHLVRPKPDAGSELALAVWVTRAGELAALQATGGVLSYPTSD